MSAMADVEAIACAAPPAPDRALARWARWLVLLLAGGLGLHSWPGGGGRQAFWLVHLVLLAWVVPAAIGCWQRSWRERIVRALPPASVWAYLAVCLLSLAAADHPGRAVTAAIKIWVCCLGVYTLAGIALTDRRRVRVILTVLTAVAAATVGVALVRCMLGGEPAGWFESPLKLGTFLAMTMPLAWGWLVSRPHRALRVAAVAVACGGLLVSGSAWGAAGTVAGITLVESWQTGARRWPLITIIAAAATLAMAWPSKTGLALRQDAQLGEADGADVRQRYLEWQALVNLLAERPIAGTGIGCLNDHRSEHYLRLPKRNTIAPFDQNGWLATAAETGLLGLAALCWVFAGHIAACWRRRREAAGGAILAGLTGAGVASIGCSVQYAGLWPALVLLLALADREARLAAEEE